MIQTPTNLLKRIDLMGFPCVRTNDELASEAAKLLGYPLWCAPEALKFLDACLASNVRPYTPESVQAFMLELKRQHTPRFAGMRRWLARQVNNAIFRLRLDERLRGWSYAVKYGAEWNIWPYEGREHLVPDRVQELVRTVRQQLPGAKFNVHVFHEKQVVIDPFLSVVYAGVEHFIAHWDESGYQPTRVI